MNDASSMPREFTCLVRGGRRPLAWATLITAIGVLLAACGGGGSKVATVARQGSSAAAASPSGSGSTTTATVLTMTSAKFGTILTDARGFVLYTYTADKPGGPGCHGPCLTLWPPLLLPGGAVDPIAGAGVAQLGTFTRPEGMQVTYQGLPLYTYLDDKQPGQITGQDVVDTGGVWLLATVGTTTAAPSGPASTSAPAAHGAVSGSPTTHAPLTNPPATQPPATQPPATQPPTTPAPTTPPPTTGPPATTPPTTVHTTPPTTAPGGGVSY
jgi:predicted lipoprotein with Yx(FWY)xxD motif